MAPSRTRLPTSADLEQRFAAPSPLSVGLEEELFVLDAESLDLTPRAHELVDAEPAAKRELIAAQVELATTPCATVGEALAQLAAARRRLANAAAERGLRLAGVGAHPFAATEGELAPGERYAEIAREYGIVASRQLVAALQVHVAVRPAARALAVHNALRGHLPELAALAAHAPFHGGRDTGLASIRPVIARQLPRQGIPPALPSWGAYAEALRRAGDPAAWWWELRPHASFGTLELRVPDSQATIADAGAIVAVAHALVAWLVARHEAGEELPVPPTDEIEERRWAALRHGPAGPMGERVAALLDTVAPFGDPDGIGHARTLLAAGGPAAQLRAAAGGDPHAAVADLVRRFLADVPSS